MFSIFSELVSQPSLILFFGSVQASAEKLGVFNLFLFYAQQQKKVFKPSFS
jgi:hypothetical protein